MASISFVGSASAQSSFGDNTNPFATAYAPITDDPQTRYEKQRFVEPVINHGYKIVSKPWKRFSDGGRLGRPTITPSPAHAGPGGGNPCLSAR